MRLLTIAALLGTALLLGCGSAAADVPTGDRSWPVGDRPLVVRAWDPPATTYGAGHRGVDLAAAPGA
ncbi:M23 family peptidase, partial [Streptomyces sp. T-3]|nr:M23 family peptidase [Streptomyces sp. T-3]